MSRTLNASGAVAVGFEGVRDAFLDNFLHRGDLGAACTVYLHGQPIVDLWGGFADPSCQTTWSPQTVVPVFSATKGALMVCVHLLIERGVVDPTTPVAAYWPEFGVNGKRRITLAWVMSHQAGVPAVDAPVTLDELADWTAITHAVAQQTPSWEPGTAHGYHPRSIGWILGEVIRRVTGETAGQFFATEVAGPLHLDWWIGGPTNTHRQFALVNPPPGDDLQPTAEAGSLQDRAFRGPSELFAYDGRWNEPEYLEPEIPSSNGVANSRAIARLYASLIGDVDGIRTLRPDTVRRATQAQVDGFDLILKRRSSFGLGFSVFPGLGANCPPGAFGHPGAGGSLGFADPSAGMSFGYVTNQLRLGRHETERADALAKAVYNAPGMASAEPISRPYAASRHPSADVCSSSCQVGDRGGSPPTAWVDRN